MVTQWGFSDKLGPLLYAEEENEVFLGRSMGKAKAMSGDTATLIDSEIKMFIDKNYQRAQTMLTDNMDILHAMKDALMKYETIDSLQIDDLMNRREVRMPAEWQKDESSDDKDSGNNTPKSEAETPVDEAKTDVKVDNKADTNDADESPAK